MTARVIAVALCLAAAVASFGLFLLVGGANPVTVAMTLVTGGASSAYGLIEAVVKAIPILFCALAAAVPGRLGLVNIGGEGQLLAGAMGAAFAVRVLPPVSSFATLLVMGVFAAGAGVAWGLLPGALRGLTRGNETVISLLLNYVAGLLLLHLIHGPWKDPASLGWPETPSLPDVARLSGMWGTRIHALLWFALALCAFFTLLDRLTVVGMASRIIGANPIAGRYVGLPVPLYYVGAFAVGGALAAIGGFGELSGIQGRLRDGMSLSYGYAGFFVAWLCRNRFEWLPVGALLFSFVVTGADSLQVFSGLPFATVYLLQGLIFLAILGSDAAQAALGRRFTAEEYRS